MHAVAAGHGVGVSEPGGQKKPSPHGLGGTMVQFTAHRYPPGHSSNTPPCHTPGSGNAAAFVHRYPTGQATGEFLSPHGQNSSPTHARHSVPFRLNPAKHRQSSIPAAPVPFVHELDGHPRANVACSTQVSLQPPQYGHSSNVSKVSTTNPANRSTSQCKRLSMTHMTERL